MHTPLPSILIALSLAACSEPPATWPDDDWGPLRAPPEVIRLAEPLLASLPSGQDPARARRQFLGRFLDGLRLPDLHQEFAAGADPIFVQAFLLGQDYRRRNAGRLDLVMRGFGYEPKTVDGDYHVGFESSTLRPSEDSNAYWWVNTMADIHLPWPKQAAGIDLDRSMRVRATGYLSAPGSYGHLSAYRHEFLAMTMVPLGK